MNGQLTGCQWRMGWFKVCFSSSLSEPSFGHFNKDGTLDVVIEEDNGNGTKRVSLVKVIVQKHLLSTILSTKKHLLSTKKKQKLILPFGFVHVRLKPQYMEPIVTV